MCPMRINYPTRHLGAQYAINTEAHCLRWIVGNGTCCFAGSSSLFLPGADSLLSTRPNLCVPVCAGARILSYLGPRSTRRSSAGTRLNLLSGQFLFYGWGDPHPTPCHGCDLICIGLEHTRRKEPTTKGRSLFPRCPAGECGNYRPQSLPTQCPLRGHLKILAWYWRGDQADPL